MMRTYNRQVSWRILKWAILCSVLIPLLATLATVGASIHRVPSKEDLRAALLAAAPVEPPLKSALLAVTYPYPLDELLLAELRYAYRIMVDSSTVTRHCGTSMVREIARTMIRDVSNRQQNSLDINTLAILISVSFSEEERIKLFAAKIPLGGTEPGVESASRRWFDAAAAELNLAEAAEIVALWGSPARLAAAAESRRVRRDSILDLAVSKGLASQDEVSKSILKVREFRSLDQSSLDSEQR